MEILRILITPILGGLIALSTNWLAIMMLFRPHTEKRLFGIKLPFTPGLIPKEWNRLTKKLSQAISSRLMTPEVLASTLSNPTMWSLPDMTIGEAMEEWGVTDKNMLTAPIVERLKSSADALIPKAIQALQNFEETQPELDSKLSELTRRVVDENLNKFAGMFFAKHKVYSSIKKGLFEYLDDPENYEIIREKVHEIIDDVLMGETETHQTITEKIYNFHIRDGLTALMEKEKHAVERVLNMIAEYISTHMPVQTMLENKLASLNVAEAEEIILTVAGRELKVIIVLGGFLGFIIGWLAVLI